MDDLVRVFTEDMNSGLEGREGALRMIPTYIEAENDFITDTPVLAIDAGGTNFRASRCHNQWFRQNTYRQYSLLPNAGT